MHKEGSFSSWAGEHVIKKEHPLNQHDGIEDEATGLPGADTKP